MCTYLNEDNEHVEVKRQSIVVASKRAVSMRNATLATSAKIIRHRVIFMSYLLFYQTNGLKIKMSCFLKAIDFLDIYVVYLSSIFLSECATTERLKFALNGDFFAVN